MKALVFLSAGVLSGTLALATPDKTPQKPAPIGNEGSEFVPTLAAAADRLDSELLFKLHCAHCHGPRGEGGRGPTLAVAKLSRANSDEAVIKIIENGIPGTEMPWSFLENDQLQVLARWVRQLGQSPVAVVRGNVEHGRQLYFERGNCASCHALRGAGGVAGPDLAEIGLRRGADYLRRALVDPEADVPENFGRYRWHTVIPDNYLQVRVVTPARQEMTGVRLNEDAFNIQIRETTGKIRSFAKADLAELHKDWGKSAMPSYRDVFSTAELDDVVAFLLSQRGAK